MSLSAQSMQYHKNLQSKPEVLGYLLDRGLSVQTLRLFQLGYSTELQGITIPYRSATGKVVLIKIRNLRDQKPKYLTLGHDFPLEQKHHLFNVSAVTLEPLVLCEGEFDCMILHQMQIPAVGLPGTDAWMDHWALLLPRDTVLLMDADSAGVAASQKIAAAARKRGKHLRIGSLPDGLDVTDLYTSDREQEIRDAIKSAH